jgi:hypothetical protein
VGDDRLQTSIREKVGGLQEAQAQGRRREWRPEGRRVDNENMSKNRLKDREGYR